MKELYLKIKRCFLLLSSKSYVLIVEKKDDRFEITHNLHCSGCCYDFVGDALNVLNQVVDIDTQEDALSEVNYILNNKN
jgi:hypothetical protein